MNVVWTANARDDLAAIGDYIGRDNPARAVTFIDEIITCGESVSKMPNAFPLVPRFERLGIRQRSFGRYLIFYRNTQSTVEIVHVLHGSQDYDRLLAIQGHDDE